MNWPPTCRTSPIRQKSAPLGTLARWFEEITNWHKARVSNGPTEIVNNLTRRTNEMASASDQSRTTGSESCSTPGGPTGTSSPPLHPARIRRIHYVGAST